MGRSPDVVVVGGGVSGVAAARELARAGASVLLLERDRLAAMASGWTLGGVRQSGRHPAELPLARAAVSRWGCLDAELEGDTGYRRGGNLRLARDEAEIAVLRRVVAEGRAAGLELDLLTDRAALRNLAPALGPEVLAASHCAGDGQAEPRETVAAYAAAARRRGAELREGVAALSLEARGGRLLGVRTAEGVIPAGRVVLAAGPHSAALLAPLGLDLPLSPRVVTVLRTEPLPPLLAQVLGVANADLAARQERGGRLRVTTGVGDWPGTVEGWTAEALMPTAGDLARLIARVARVLPALDGARVSEVWGGLIDLTPDGLPVLDAPPEAEGLVVLAGFSGHGFALGPVTGEIAADLALGRAARHDLSAFRLSRLAGRGASAPLELHG